MQAGVINMLKGFPLKQSLYSVCVCVCGFWVFDITYIALQVREWTFSSLKIDSVRYVSEHLDNLCMWNLNKTYRRFSKSGLGAIQLELYLLFFFRPWSSLQLHAWGEWPFLSFTT